MLGLLKALMFLDWSQPAAAMLQNPGGGEEIVVDSEDAWAAIQELGDNGVRVGSFISDPLDTNKTILFINRDDAQESGISQSDYREEEQLKKLPWWQR